MLTAILAVVSVGAVFGTTIMMGIWICRLPRLILPYPMGFSEMKGTESTLMSPHRRGRQKGIR